MLEYDNGLWIYGPTEANLRTNNVLRRAWACMVGLKDILGLVVVYKHTESFFYFVLVEEL